LPWDEIKHHADKYIADQDREIAGLVERIEEKKKQLAHALEGEQVADYSADVDKLAELMQPIFELYRTPANDNSGLDNMIQSRCGADRVGKARFTNKYEDSVAAFSASLDAALASQPRFTLSHGDSVVATCLTVLGASDSPSNCQELCHAIQSVASAKSSAASVASNGHHAGLHGSEQLQDELEKLSALLASATALRSDCDNAKTELLRFEEHMRAIQQNVAAGQSAFVSVRDSLKEATWELEDLDADAKDHNEALRQLVDALSGANQVQAALATKLSDLQSQAAEAHRSIADTAADLHQVQNDIESASIASSVTLEFRQKLSNLLVQMVFSFDQAVRKPLESMGLGPKAKIEEKFPAAAVEAVESSTLDALTKMTKFCADNRDAFSLADAAVQKAHTLEGEAHFAELCELSDAKGVALNFKDIIQARVNSVTKLLQDAQSWTDPLKGLRPSSHAAVNEIEGLRAVMFIYQDSPFYKSYLKAWKGDEKFSMYYAALGAALTQMKDTETHLISRLASFQDQLKALLASIEATNQDLDSALDAQRAAGTDVAVAEEKAQGLRDAADALRAKIASLEKKTAEFSDAYQLAIQTYQQAYSEATALVQISRH